MRVIFAGHTGLEKATVVANLIESVLARYRLPTDPNAEGGQRFLRPYALERTVEKQIKAASVSLLETANPSYADEQWGLAFESILEDVEQRDPDHVFLEMHLTFHVPGRSLTPYFVDQLRSFRTTHIVTLIDDIYEVQARVEWMNAQRGTEYHISLRQLAWWRAQEIGQGAWLAKNLPPSAVERGGRPEPVKHFVVAVKHPVEMLVKLLFLPELPKVYASFPITSTRNSVEGRGEIDSVRSKLHSLHTVFDPLTIDELCPWVIGEAEKEPNGTVTLTRGDPRCRWPIDESQTLARGRSDVYPLKLRAQEVLDVKSLVEHSIRLRDFGFVDACDYVVGYRPSYEGAFSRGMFAEFNHAHNVCRPPVPIHYYSPSEDKAPSSPFDQFPTNHPKQERWWGVVENLKPYSATLTT